MLGFWSGPIFYQPPPYAPPIYTHFTLEVSVTVRIYNISGLWHRWEWLCWSTGRFKTDGIEDTHMFIFLYMLDSLSSSVALFIMTLTSAIYIIKFWITKMHLTIQMIQIDKSESNICNIIYVKIVIRTLREVTFVAGEYSVSDNIDLSCFTYFYI